jgi:hypothetical protein
LRRGSTTDEQDTRVKDLRAAANVDELVRRLNQVQPTSTRQWGKMTSHEMVCHLSDSFLAVMGERQVTSKENWLTRTLVKYVAIHTSIPWPKGVPTTPEVDQKVAGTKPVEFERDRAQVLELLSRFVGPGSARARHPAFGAMTRDEWMIWGYRHVDHHLRQFSC